MPERLNMFYEIKGQVKAMIGAEKVPSYKSIMSHKEHDAFISYVYRVHSPLCELTRFMLPARRREFVIEKYEISQSVLDSDKLGPLIKDFEEICLTDTQRALQLYRSKIEDYQQLLQKKTNDSDWKFDPDRDLKLHNLIKQFLAETYIMQANIEKYDFKTIHTGTFGLYIFEVPDKDNNYLKDQSNGGQR